MNQFFSVANRVQPLRKLLASPDLLDAFGQHWDFICSTINYVPIFSIARRILLEMPAGSSSDEAVRRLAARALEIWTRKAALRHDLMGRVYHWLLHYAKYLGTYYTSVPAATLLLKLALDPDRWPINWGNIEALRNFRVADLACGTGTLLMAASQALTDNYISRAAEAGAQVDDPALRELHRALMEDITHGYDVLPSAIHLTASTLALLAPEIAFRKMHLYSLPLGKVGGKIYLGSVEFLASSILNTQFDLMGETPIADAAGGITGGGLTASEAPLPDLDLCVMNPPFVRSVGGNLLFGSLPGDRGEMQKKLRNLLASRKSGQPVLASSTAGLGSVFVAVADRHIKPGGRLALVLPAALTTGVAWANTRTLIEEKYDLELVVASHEADHWNFSENTDLSEVLVVARKKEAGRASEGGSTTFVNLLKSARRINPSLAFPPFSLATAGSARRFQSRPRGSRESPGLAAHSRKRSWFAPRGI